MEEESNPNSSIDSKCGFCSRTKTYHSLRPNVSLPPESIPLSVTDYAFSLIESLPSPESTTAIIDINTGNRISYSELVRWSKNLAAYLQIKIGLVKGDSALILTPNSIETLILYFSLLSLGVIISPSNPANTKPEIARQIDICKPAIAFATETTSFKIPPLRHSTILLDSADFQSMLTGSICVHKRVNVLQSDPATIMCSSGTTGKVKGVLMTHRSWISAIAIGQAVPPAATASTAVVKPVAMCMVPCFHVYGFGFCVLSISVGRSVAVMERFDLRRMMSAIGKYQVTHLAVAPPVVISMVRDDGLMDGYDFRSLQVVTCGGAALPRSAITKFRNRLPKVYFMQAYGLTETCGAITRMGPEGSEVLGSVGRLLPNWQAKIVDPETGINLAIFKQGELWVKAPTMLNGYIGDTDESVTKWFDPEGWFRTGDICYFNSEGHLFFVDRLKEMIKCKGFQVAPAELEHLLQSHPDVIEAAVIPYPDEEAEQVPMAFIVRQPGSTIDEQKIKDFVAKEVAPYKRIRRVAFIDSIPKNAPGKVLRKELIKLALSNASSKL